jgi:hypothetical protein
MSKLENIKSLFSKFEILPQTGPEYEAFIDELWAGIIVCRMIAQENDEDRWTSDRQEEIKDAQETQIQLLKLHNTLKKLLNN